jgi:hypothetical protein
MDADALLLGRLRALQERLNFAGAAVGTTARFAEVIKDLHRQLDRYIRAAAEPEPRFDWRSLSDTEEKCAGIFREVLTFQRRDGGRVLQDDSAAMLARELVRELATALRLGEPPPIAPDVDDSFSDNVESIRLRYPPAGIWDVPVVAHELGHFVAYRLTAVGDGLQRSQPVREFIEGYFRDSDITRSNDQDQWRYWLNEFFADAFAVHCVGPSFAASALLLRFDAARRHSGTHPSSAARAAAILAGLGAISDKEAPYAIVIGRLRALWSQLVKLGGIDPESRGAMEKVRKIALELYPLVQKIAPRAGYRNWSFAADTLRFALTDDEPVTGAFEVRDLLNAAWLARAARPDVSPEDISARAIALWRGADDRQRVGR